MNNNDELKTDTKAFAFIAFKATSDRFSTIINKLFKDDESNAMIIPMNIRHDDFFYTMSNMKNSKLDGAVISEEFTKDIIEHLDSKSEAVEKYGVCDIVILKDKKFYGDYLFISTREENSEEFDYKKITIYLKGDTDE